MMITVVVGLLAAPASAEPSNMPLAPAGAVVGAERVNTGLFLLRNKQTKRCLDGDAMGNVYTLPCNAGNQYQQWRYYLDFTWAQNNTTRCLIGDSNTRRVSSNRWSCTGVNAEWIWRGTGQESVYMLELAFSNFCLDSNSEPDGSGVAWRVFVSRCNADDLGQRWYLDAVP